MADWSRCKRGAIAGLVVPLLIIVLAGCGITGGQVQSADEIAGDNARSIWDLFVPIFWLSVVIFVLVQGALIWAVIRFRAKRADEVPPQLHGNTKVEVAWTIAPAVILAVILVPTVTTIADLASEPEDSYTVDVVGHQWWWEFDYQDEDDEFATGNVMHIPVDQPIRVRMTSSDVIHSFYAPNLFGKQDVIPGRTTNIYFTAEEPGEYYGQCYEFCGAQHANMHFRIVVHEQDDYDSWVADQQDGAAEPEEGTQEARGKEVFFEAACQACHTIDGAVAEDGTEATGQVGPNLTNIGDRPIIGAGALENTPENLRDWIRDSQEAKPGNEMPMFSEDSISDEDLDALVAYLSSLQ